MYRPATPQPFATGIRQKAADRLRLAAGTRARPPDSALEHGAKCAKAEAGVRPLRPFCHAGAPEGAPRSFHFAQLPAAVALPLTLALASNETLTDAAALTDAVAADVNWVATAANSRAQLPI